MSEPVQVYTACQFARPPQESHIPSESAMHFWCVVSCMMPSSSYQLHSFFYREQARAIHPCLTETGSFRSGHHRWKGVLWQSSISRFRKKKNHSQRLCWSIVSNRNRRANTNNILVFWNSSERDAKMSLPNWSRPSSVFSSNRFPSRL